MPTLRRDIHLGIRLSREENRQIIRLARYEGLPKSLYARRILRAVAQGTITICNPAPEADKITMQDIK